MLGLRTHALVTGGLFAALLILGWGGNAVDAYGLMPHTPGVQIGTLIFFLLLTVALAFSAVPLMVLLVVQFHIAAGNANRPGIRLVVAHARVIVFVIWGLMAVGLLLAIPAAIADGAFSFPDQPDRMTHRAASPVAAPDESQNHSARNPRPIHPIALGRQRSAIAQAGEVCDDGHKIAGIWRKSVKISSVVRRNNILLQSQSYFRLPLGILLGDPSGDDMNDAMTHDPIKKSRDRSVERAILTGNVRRHSSRIFGDHRSRPLSRGALVSSRPSLQSLLLLAGVPAIR